MPCEGISSISGARYGEGIRSKYSAFVDRVEEVIAMVCMVKEQAITLCGKNSL